MNKDGGTWINDADDDAEKQYLTRFVSVMILLVAGICIVVIHYGRLMLDPSRRAAETTAEQMSNTERGAIVDRNGKLLAVETKLGMVSLQKNEVSSRNPTTGQIELNMEVCRDISRKLSPLLGMSAEEILTKISSSPTDYVSLKQKLGKQAIDALRAARSGLLAEDERARIIARFARIGDEEGGKKAIKEAEIAAYNNRKNLEKVRIDIQAEREYPEKNLASQIIGIMGKDKGLEGIEYAFDSDLHPTSQENGKQLTLSIDTNVQYFLEQIAADALEQNKAQAVMLTAMDARNGEILGSASLPHFDPNDYNAYPGAVWRYQPALYAYEPGSVFKIFTVAALLDEGAITGNSTFDCTGRYDRVNPAITDLAVHGTVNAERIIALSCNVGVSLASDRIEVKPFFNKLRSFGFGQLVGSGSPSETSGIFREESNRRFKPTLAIGQGVSVSMLQMLHAASAIANKGVLVRPKLVLKITGPNGEESPYPAIPDPPTRVMSADTAASMLTYMQAAAAVDGTGWRAAIGDIPMAVKTGTAQMAENGRYSESDFIASCMAIFPADDPRLILYAVIVKPYGESYLGGRIATIPVRHAAESLMDYLKLHRGRNPVERQSATVYFDPEPPLPTLEGVMPDFRDYSKISLIPLIEADTGYTIRLEGNGHVKAQDPPAGSELVHGDIITLYLE